MTPPTQDLGARGDAGARDGVGARGGVGARLRSARERAGLSPIQAAEKLHIETGTLEALEAERFGQLGAPVYVRGYLRHYADLVGESPAELQDLYAASADATRVPDLTHIAKVESARTTGPLLFPGVLVVVAVALIGVAWWISGNVGSSRTQRGGVASALSPAQRGARGGGAPVAGRALAPGAAGRLQPRPRIPTPHADAAPGSAGEGSAAEAQQSSDEYGPPAPARPGIGLRAKTAALQIHFTEDSWTEIYDARGERLFYDVGFAGSTRTVRGIPPLRIVLGNPPEVALELDGRPVAVPQAARNVVTEFRIERSGRVAPMRLAVAESHGSGGRRRAADPREIN